jgi:SecD/SecF fusion protein
MRTSPWLLAIYAAIILFGVLSALPNVLGANVLAHLPSWFPHERVTLGLDLRGGSHLVLEVDSAALEKARLKAVLDDADNALHESGVRLQSRKVVDGRAVIGLRGSSDMRSALAALQGIASSTVVTPRGTDVPEFSVTADGNAISIAFTQQGLEARVDAAVAQSLEVVRRRVDEVGVAEPTVQRAGDDRIVVQLPGLQDPTRFRELLGSTAQLNFYLLAGDGSSDGNMRAGTAVLPSEDGATSYRIQDRVAVSGERLLDAHAGFDPRTGEPIVSFRFDSAGARRFGEITRANVGRQFAIVLDGKVLSAPVIHEPILGGSGQIGGSFSVAETVTLSALLRAGALPAPLTIIDQSSVGAALGGDAIHAGVTAGLAGFALVALLMLILYRGWGLVANLALTLNVALTLAALGLIGATLTLPGIAGLILSLGVAVDANILINERIKEETRKGANANAALHTGFRRAYSTIVDSNVTTLIATALLFAFGSGPIRGFAVTMMLGVGISMFTAVAVVRIVMSEIVRRRRLRHLDLKPLVTLVPVKTAISFMKARYLGLVFSALLSIASIGLMVNPGLSYGLDFKGGVEMLVRSTETIDLAAVRAGLDELGLGEVALQTIGEEGDVLVRVERQPGGEEAQTAAVDTLRAAVATLAPGSTIESATALGPKISGELAQAGILAVAAATLAMLVYIWWRFEWYFAIGAIATLVLDVTKTLGFFALTGIEFNLTAVAALLTIIGYSVNDKVVVYDRMRENLRREPQMTLRSVIDRSINESLSRCIFTSATAFLAMLPIAIEGGSALASFATPMAFGIVIATSSSIFIAAPMLLLLGDWHRRRASARRTAAAADDEAWAP